MSEDSDEVPATEKQDVTEGTREQALAGIAGVLESIRMGRLLAPYPGTEPINWDLHESRVREIEQLVRTGSGPGDGAEVGRLQEIFWLDYQADVARMMAHVNEDMVRILDKVSASVEEKKFEVSSDVRDEMEDLLLPYHDRFREEILGQLPIEKRQQLETEAQRRREAGEPPTE